MSLSVRSLLSATAAALAALALGGCAAAPYGYGGYGGYGNGYSNGYSNGYGSGTYVSQDGYGSTATSYPVATAPEYTQAYPQSPSYPQQPAYGQAPAYPQQSGYPQQPAYGEPGYAQGAPAYGVRYGWVESIELLQAQPASPSGAGAVVGGLVGGLLGHQVGGGRGNTVATIGGAVVGALAGNEVEKRASTAPQVFRLRVRTNDNAYLTLTQSDAYRLRNGDRVKIENGVAMPY